MSRAGRHKLTVRVRLRRQVSKTSLRLEERWRYKDTLNTPSMLEFYNEKSMPHAMRTQIFDESENKLRNPVTSMMN